MSARHERNMSARTLPRWLRVGASDDAITEDALASSEIDGWVADSVDASDADSSDVTISEDVASRTSSGTKTPSSSSSVTVLKAIQGALVKLGYDIGPTGVDGKIGPRTRAAITKFKSEHGVTPINGQITAAFRTALTNAVAAQSTPNRSASASGAATTVGWIVLGLGASVALVFAVKRWLPV